jgi:hypothetical protein
LYRRQDSLSADRQGTYTLSGPGEVSGQSECFYIFNQRTF